MKRLGVYLLLFSLLSTAACNSDDSPVKQESKFVPTDVIIKTKGYFTIDQVFEFINGLGLNVEYVDNGIYNSDLPSDSLDYVLNSINSKPYINSSWPTGGYLHYQTNRITIFPRLFQIENKTYQDDWLVTMDSLRLVEKTDEEVSGYVIYFHVPEGQELEWVSRFKKYSFVEWAEPNYIIDIELY